MRKLRGLKKTGVKPGYAKNKTPTTHIIQGFQKIDLSIDSPQVHKKQHCRALPYGAVFCCFERCCYLYGPKTLLLAGRAAPQWGAFRADRAGRRDHTASSGPR